MKKRHSTEQIAARLRQADAESGKASACVSSAVVPRLSQQHAGLKLQLFEPPKINCSQHTKLPTVGAWTSLLTHNVPVSGTTLVLHLCGNPHGGN